MKIYVTVSSKKLQKQVIEKKYHKEESDVNEFKRNIRNLNLIVLRKVFNTYVIIINLVKELFP